MLSTNVHTKFSLAFICTLICTKSSFSSTSPLISSYFFHILIGSSQVKHPISTYGNKLSSSIFSYIGICLKFAVLYLSLHL